MEQSEDDENNLDEDGVQMEPPIFISDPHLSMRILSLPVLESLVSTNLLQQFQTDTDSLKSTQILSTLAQGPYSRQSGLSQSQNQISDKHMQR